MAQTPTQRRANAKYARTEEKRMGKPESATVNKRNKDKASSRKSPISPTLIILLAFVVFGGLALEFFKLFPVVFEFFDKAWKSVLALFQ